jgi:hypothetical protein
MWLAPQPVPVRPGSSSILQAGQLLLVLVLPCCNSQILPTHQWVAYPVSPM